MQIDAIKRTDIVRLLDGIEDENGPVMADKTLAFLSKLFSWHASRSDEFRSPIVRGMARTKPQERTRSRILSDEELRAIWRATGEYRHPFGPMLRFILLTATRRNEAVYAKRSEITDTEWTIPAARYKTKLDHLIPLSDMAMAQIWAGPLNLGVTTQSANAFIFTSNGRAISGLGRHKRAIDEASGVTGWWTHDLRRTARSLMSRAGVSSDHAERCLGHVIGGVRGVYDRHEYVEEKKRAFEALASQIDRIVNPQAANVVPIRGETAMKANAKRGTAVQAMLKARASLEASRLCSNQFANAVDEIAKALNLPREIAQAILFGLIATGEVRASDKTDLIDLDECTIAELQGRPAFVAAGELRMAGEPSQRPITKSPRCCDCREAPGWRYPWSQY